MNQTPTRSSLSGRIEFEELGPNTCIMTDEYGRAEYMFLTEDGRWVPLEESF